MFKKGEIVMLATKDEMTGVKEGNSWQHLYITSDEKIEEGDWFTTFTHLEGCRLKQAKKIKDSLITCEDLELIHIDMTVRKVIASTNLSLIRQGMAKIPQNFLKEYCDRVNAGEVIKEVEVEYEVDVIGTALGRAKENTWEKWSQKKWELKLTNNQVNINAGKPKSLEELAVMPNVLGPELDKLMPVKPHVIGDSGVGKESYMTITGTVKPKLYTYSDLMFALTYGYKGKQFGQSQEDVMKAFKENLNL